jgi:hypothetical protein
LTTCAGAATPQHTSTLRRYGKRGVSKAPEWRDESAIFLISPCLGETKTPHEFKNSLAL